MTPCPSDDDLLRFADGTLPPAARGTIDTHVDGCSACRVALSALAPERVVADERLGRYRIDGVLGRGAMGLVLRAHDPELDRAVALKLVRADGDDARRARLRREAQALARLNHPHVCQVYDVGDDGDETYVALELVDGCTLREHLATHPTPEAIVACIVAAGRGLAAAHAAGVVHRDVKPDNLLVARDGRVVVSDFGADHALGTLGYAAPEQLLGQPVDARADQFGLCATAWEALTGQPPFDADTVGAQLLAIGRGPRAPAPADRATAAALRRGLASDQAARFPSMSSLIDALAPPKRARRGWILASAAFAATSVAVLAYVAFDHDSTPPPPLDAATIADRAVDAPATVDAPPIHAAPIDAAPIDAGTIDAGRGPIRGTTVAPDLVDIGVATWCHLSVDPAAPDPSLAPWHRADWGKVARVARAAYTDTFVGRRHDIALVEVRGVAGMHRVVVIDTPPPAAGALVIVCVGGAAPEDIVAQLPADWRGDLHLPTFLAPIARPPLITTKAALAPVHVNAADLGGAARTGTWLWPRAKSVVARVLIGDDLGDHRFAIGSGDQAWTVEVPTGTPGAAAVAPGAAVWIVVASPRFEGKRLTVTALDVERRYVAANR